MITYLLGLIQGALIVILIWTYMIIRENEKTIQDIKKRMDNTQKEIERLT